MKPQQIEAAVDTTEAHCFGRKIKAGAVIRCSFVPVDCEIPARAITPERLAEIEALRGGRASALLFALAVLAEEVGE